MRKLSVKINSILGAWGNALLVPIERGRKSFLTYTFRPAGSELIEQREKNLSYPKCAIILQGALVKDRDFTLETVRIYKKLFPESEIIVSTWRDEDQGIIKEAEKENVIVLLNERPAYGGSTGHPNINLQIVSSFSGVKKAKELGCEYVLKTRTDQRIYSPEALRFFYALTNTFPPAAGYKQKNRIVGVSLNTYKYRMYGMSDMTLFGSINDMMLFWGVDLDNRTEDKTVRDSLRELAELKLAEIYLVTNFMEKIGRNLKWTLYDSWAVFRDHLCIIDQQSIELYWHKYKRHEENKRPQYYYEKTDKEMGFASWFELYANLSEINVDESILDLPFREKIPLSLHHESRL